MNNKIKSIALSFALFVVACGSYCVLSKFHTEKRRNAVESAFRRKLFSSAINKVGNERSETLGIVIVDHGSRVAEANIMLNEVKL
jgi:hypothetical protein